MGVQGRAGSRSATQRRACEAVARAEHHLARVAAVLVRVVPWAGAGSAGQGRREENRGATSVGVAQTALALPSMRGRSASGRSVTWCCVMRAAAVTSRVVPVRWGEEGPRAPTRKVVLRPGSLMGARACAFHELALPMFCSMLGRGRHGGSRGEETPVRRGSAQVTCAPVVPRDQSLSALLAWNHARVLHLPPRRLRLRRLRRPGKGETCERQRSSQRQCAAAASCSRVAGGEGHVRERQPVCDGRPDRTGTRGGQQGVGLCGLCLQPACPDAADSLPATDVRAQPAPSGCWPAGVPVL